VKLCDSLQQQIQSSVWNSQVEVLFELDNGELSIGRKRNLLMERASGQWIAFIDDDDLVSSDYVDLICSAIARRPEIDCIGIKAVITFRGSHPREVFYSLQYHDVFSRNHTYYRPPYHLNPIRREIARQYQFLNVNYSEDFEWAEQIRRDEVLQNEEIIDSVIYYYRSRRLWAYQWLLDVTEGVRHRFGIRLTNRFVAKKALSSAVRTETD
jgi:glycosyltransferase involved in cell wall biosynthesis